MKQLLKVICAILFATSLAGCGDSSDEGLNFTILTAPQAVGTVNGAWLEVSWNKVSNAEAYAVEVTEDTGKPVVYRTVMTSYSVAMKAGSKYSVRIKSLAGSNKAFVDSEWSNKVEAERPAGSTPTPTPTPMPTAAQ